MVVKKLVLKKLVLKLSGICVCIYIIFIRVIKLTLLINILYIFDTEWKYKNPSIKNNQCLQNFISFFLYDVHNVNKTRTKDVHKNVIIEVT